MCHIIERSMSTEPGKKIEIYLDIHFSRGNKLRADNNFFKPEE